ncbi:glutamine amidotransferase [Bartonella sp. F02]|uniref:glutamine amidotransferase n=1 Tax=Bartonella sp. F02 TaxID=2967262 RepID=UPI0022A9417D|nr:glutamine amidotransferase [Bartonella sp. F02]MCZ2327875.1 glutamine amidotransferase [Bartonella sp. F02]
MSLVEKCFCKQQRNNKPRIAVVLHRQFVYTGRLGQFLQQNGFILDIYRPIFGQKLPNTLENYAGVVILGGPMSVNDKDAYICKEIDWISLSLKNNKPFLGICLGAQMLARNIGGCVHTRNDGFVEVGWYPLEATSQGKALMEWPEMVYQFHDEGIYDLPKEAVLLATGQLYPTQAFRYGNNAWGIQFHAEFTRAMMRRLVVCSAQKLTEKGAQPVSAHFEGRLVYDRALRKWFKNMLLHIFGAPCCLAYEN